MGWIQVEAFKKRLKEYQEATKKNQLQVAEDLGTTYGTLRFWLSGTRPPKPENIQKAAKLFNCSITEFMDDPGGDLPGVPKAELDKLSEAKRAVMFMMFQNLKQEEVSDEQSLQYLEVIESLVKAGKIRKPRYE